MGRELSEQKAPDWSRTRFRKDDFGRRVRYDVRGHGWLSRLVPGDPDHGGSRFAKSRYLRYRGGTDNIADVRDLERLFPLVQPAVTAPDEGDVVEDATEVEARIEKVRKHISWAQLGDSLNSGNEDEEGMKLGRRYCRYQSVEDLPGTARIFHEKAGKSSSRMSPGIGACC